MDPMGGPHTASQTRGNRNHAWLELDASCDPTPVGIACVEAACRIQRSLSA
jgi:hypothetical protein